MPNTITEMLDNMRAFVAEGDLINASDVPFEQKLTELTALSQRLGLYE